MSTKTPAAGRSMAHAALGLRVKSGWASAVLLGGAHDAPRLLNRRRIQLADPRVPGSLQPYHAGFGTLQTDVARVRRLTRIVERTTRRSLSGLVRECRAGGSRVRGLGLVVGSLGDPESIANPHVRAHAYEGRLFRTALQRAARGQGLSCRVALERDLLATVARETSVPSRVLRRMTLALGREAGSPWRAEEKQAALAAWLVLAGRRGRGRS